MAKSKLIKDTTRAEREEIIKLALAGCGNGSCDNCGSCSLGAGDPYGTYQPYIDGEMEIADINMMVAERNAKLFGLQRRCSRPREPWAGPAWSERYRSARPQSGHRRKP